MEERLVSAVGAPFFYIKLFLTPLATDAEYSGRYLRPLSRPSPLIASGTQPFLLILALLLHLGAVSVVFRVCDFGARQATLRWVSCSWVGFVVLLLPTLGLSGHHATDLYAADRYFCKCAFSSNFWYYHSIPTERGRLAAITDLPAVVCVIPGLSVLFFESMLRLRQFGGRAGYVTAVGVLVAAITAITIQTCGYADVWSSDSTLYPHLIRCNPEDLLARNNYAAWFARHNRHAEAVHVYDNLLEMFPQHPKANLYRAVSLSRVDVSTNTNSNTNAETALSKFDDMLSVGQSRDDVRYHRAGVLTRLKRFAEAEAEYETLTRSHLVSPNGATPVDKCQNQAYDEPVDAELGLFWMSYGSLRQEQQRYSEAEHCFRQALLTTGAGMTQTRAEAMISLAAVLMSSAGRQKNNQVVLEEIAGLREKARRIAPTNPSVLINHANGKALMQQRVRVRKTLYIGVLIM
eukprot:COSAG02_NODE_329_length_24516_cov_11.403448_12_plen_462_part_00